MAEYDYKAFSDHLKNTGTKDASSSFVPVYLIYGEEFLYKTALNELVDAMIPPAKRSLYFDPFEDTHDNIQKAIERMNTYSLLPGRRVVAVCDSNIFYTKQDESKLIEKARIAYGNQDNKAAAKYLLSLMGILNLKFEDLRTENRSKALKILNNGSSDDAWLDKIIHYCIENSLSVPFYEDRAAMLQKAVEKGFPPNNHLIITADLIDKRRILYKTIRQKGVIIDCSIPKGSRKADRAAQEAALNERKEALLKRAGKTIDKTADRAMRDMTGFDLRTFSHNIEKLISYVGERSTITGDDVQAVLKRTKKDPIYELTNAISDRNIQASMFMINSLLAENLHPLQILAAIINQIRKLLMARGFMESPHGVKWHAGVHYNSFKSSVIPAIQAYDRLLLDRIGSWETSISKKKDSGNLNKTQKGTARKTKSKTDLVLAKSPNNPYPVFQLLQSSEKYTTDELTAALEELSRADIQLKSSKQPAKLILEKTVISICRGNR